MSLVQRDVVMQLLCQLNGKYVESIKYLFVFSYIKFAACYIIIVIRMYLYLKIECSLLSPFVCVVWMHLSWLSVFGSISTYTIMEYGLWCLSFTVSTAPSSLPFFWERKWRKRKSARIKWKKKVVTIWWRGRWDVGRKKYRSRSCMVKGYMAKMECRGTMNILSVTITDVQKVEKCSISKYFVMLHHSASSFLLPLCVYQHKAVTAFFGSRYQVSFLWK